MRQPGLTPVVAAMALALGAATAASAAPIHVGSLVDDADTVAATGCDPDTPAVEACTLRAAIVAANERPGHDTAHAGRCRKYNT